MKKAISIILAMVMLGLILLSGSMYNTVIMGGLILAGLLFVINPVWPAAWNRRDPKKMKMEARIAGVLIVLLGIFGRFHG